MKPYFREILDSYKLKRDRAIREQSYRLKEIYDFIPRIKAIDEAVVKEGMNLTKLAITQAENLDEALKRVEHNIKALKQEKAILMTENNVPLNFLDVFYECSTCNDTGYDSEGKMCRCFRQQLIENAYTMSNLSGVLAKENFASFNLQYFSEEPFEGEALSPRDNMQKILDQVEAYALHFNDTSDNLLFYGPTGQGKTFLCNCVAKSLLDQGFTVVYQTAFNLIKTLETQRFSQDKQTQSLAAEHLFEADLLIIDDLGTEFVNTFSTLELFNVINTRMLSEKKTVISTNLTPIQLKETYSERISSRLFGHYQFIYFYGKDLRWEV